MNIDEKLKDLINICENEVGNKRYVEMYNILVEIKNNGKREGHRKAVEMCKDALEGLENSNSSSY
tara:strand:+ start:1588 stop:1782 length:195 start_codon:yes stop_codon:yes gene_type:complete